MKTTNEELITIMDNKFVKAYFNWETKTCTIMTWDDEYMSWEQIDFPLTRATQIRTAVLRLRDRFHRRKKK